MNPVLSSAFKEQVRPLLDLVDKIRSSNFDEENDIAVPKITIVGDQSSGKSSVVEALSGVCLPRGTGIVTRAPLQLRMVNDASKPWSAKVTYTKANQDVTIDITDPQEIGTKVLEVQTVLTDGNDKAVSDTEIRLEVRSASVPDLTVVDLPGIVRVAGDDQEPDIEQKIKNLIGKYINRTSTIILVVCPANVDVAVNESIKIAKQVDPSGERTLGVVTKPDLVGRGEENATIKIANNQSSVKLMGQDPWIIVKARSQQDLNDNIPLSQALEEEDTFFENHQHFNKIDKTKRGIKNLATKLTQSLTSRIKSELPELHRQLNHATIKFATELKELGEGPPEDLNDLRTYLIGHIGKFNENLRAKSLGLEGHHCNDRNEVHLFSAFRQLCEQLARNIDECRPDTPDAYYEKTTEEVSPSEGSPSNSKDDLSSVSVNTQRLTIRKTILRRKSKMTRSDSSSSVFESPSSQNKMGTMDEELLEEIRHQMELRRGALLPVYEKPAVVEAKIKEFITKCRPYILQCLEEVYHQVELDFERLATFYLHQFPYMESVAKEIISRLSKVANRDCRKALSEYMEMEDMMFEQDNIYRQELDHVSKLIHINADLEVKSSTLNSSPGVQVLLADPGEWCKNESKKHLLNLKVYFRIASRRMMEIAPMKIQYVMLLNLSKSIADHMNAHIANASTDDIRVMGEDPEVAAVRSQLRKKLKSLEESTKILTSLVTKDVQIVF